MSNILFYEPSYNVDRLFEHAFAHALRPFVNTARTSRTPEGNSVVHRVLKPRMDLREDSENNLTSATFELPGINKDDVHLEARNGFLTVSAETKSSAEQEKNGVVIRERQYGKFSRSLKLPTGIKDEDIKAAMADGVLTITFPSSSPEQEPKKIIVA